MTDNTCGCCAGVAATTPLATYNRPGLAALAYRIGTHPDFLDSMIARLTTHALEDGARPLQALRTRDPTDPAIALLDAWATVADVLSFYQERIANEGFLMTATERRSVLELARLVGYRLRPGVAASTFLAFTLEKGFEIEIPTGTGARALPEPGQSPEPFETAEPLQARSAWNAIGARLKRPFFWQREIRFSGTRTLYLAGVATGLATNNLLLIHRASETLPFVVRAVEPDAAADLTVARYADPLATMSGDDDVPADSEAGKEEDGQTVLTPLAQLSEVVAALRRDPSAPPASRFRLARPSAQTYAPGADLAPQILAELDPGLRSTIFTAYANSPVTGDSADLRAEVAVMRVTAAPFGATAPLDLVFSENRLIGRAEWPLSAFDLSAARQGFLSLDGLYDGILPGSRVVLDWPQDDRRFEIYTVREVRSIARADYGISQKVTLLRLDRPWLVVDDTGEGTEITTEITTGNTTGVTHMLATVPGRTLAVLRTLTIYAQNEGLDLAEAPILTGVGADEIELDGLYEGLDIGRWIMVGGERADVLTADGTTVEGIRARELAMIAGVTHEVQSVTLVADANGTPGATLPLPGDTLHTRLTLAEPLAYTYRRDSVAINANVVRATHGETVRETLGSAAASAVFQTFALARAPLTHLSAADPDGVATTLELRVNEIRWPETETLLDLGADDRGFETVTDNAGVTRVIFGDGKRGARPPSGVENVTAVYRAGIGRGGNVQAGQISTLPVRPLGVKEVVNPRPASGGADPESRDQARAHAPLAVRALDRLVSVGDYTDFARLYAGIGKAHARRITDGMREVLHLTLAGADDAPIDPQSDLYRNLSTALRDFGDPSLPLQLAAREVLLVFVSARVTVHPDHLWEIVAPRLRTALLDSLGFEKRALGQPLHLGEVFGVMQAVAGVDYVDIDLFETLSETEAATPETLAARLADFAARGPDTRPRRYLPAALARLDPTGGPGAAILPAQIAYLTPALPDTLVLTEATR